jgi:hypothetical protein
LAAQLSPPPLAILSPTKTFFPPTIVTSPFSNRPTYGGLPPPTAPSILSPNPRFPTNRTIPPQPALPQLPPPQQPPKDPPKKSSRPREPSPHGESFDEDIALC